MSEKQAKNARRAKRRQVRRDLLAPVHWSLPPAFAQQASHATVLLATTLSAAVPLQILTLYEQGRPTLQEIEQARIFDRVLAERGQVLLAGSPEQGEVATLFNDLTHALAALAFLPGGAPAMCGQHFEALAILAGFFGMERAHAYCQQILARAR